MLIVLRDKNGLEKDRRQVWHNQRSSQALIEWMKDNPDLFEGDYFIIEIVKDDG